MDVQEIKNILQKNNKDLQNTVKDLKEKEEQLTLIIGELEEQRAGIANAIKSLSNESPFKKDTDYYFWSEFLPDVIKEMDKPFVLKELMDYINDKYYSVIPEKIRSKSLHNLVYTLRYHLRKFAESGFLKQDGKVGIQVIYVINKKGKK